MAAPIGNQFSYNGGRPPKFDNPEDMWNKAVEYFESKKLANGQYKPTIEGLTFYLGSATIITKLISYRCCHCFFRNFLFHLLKT
jgi:hypothetical protein